MQPSRVVQLLLPLTLLLAPPLSAQDSRLAVGPFGAYRWASTMYEHAVRDFIPSQGGLDYGHQERLRIAGAPLVGARVEYRLRPAWSVYAAGAYGRTAYDFHENTVLVQIAAWPSSTPLISAPRWHQGDATIMSLAVGVGRHFQTLARGPIVELSLGGAVEHTRLAKEPCVPGAWDDYAGGCDSYDQAYVRLEPRYNVPSVTGGLAVRQRVRRRVEVQARAGYAYARANTESMQVDSRPMLDHGEAPASQWFGVLQLSGGATVTF